MIWWNSKIRINGVPFFWRNPYLKQLKWVSDLYENEKLITPEIAAEKYCLTVLQYNALISAIPKKLKDAARQNPATACYYDEMCNKKHLSRIIYSELIKIDVNADQVTIQKWEEDLGSTIDSWNFRKLFAQIYVTTNFTKYRSFQYRLVHRAIVTNMHLYRWGIKTSNMCHFCGLSKETLTHLFFHM